MISEGNKNMQEAGETLFILNGDDKIRDQCEAREDYRRTWDGVKQEINELQMKIEELISSNEKLEAQNAELQRQLQS